MRSRHGSLWLLLVALVALATGGCSTRYVTVREVPESPLVERLNLVGRGGPQPSQRSMQLLGRFDLVDRVEEDPADALVRLQEYQTQFPSADLLYTLAETAFLAGKRVQKSDPPKALGHFAASVGYAYQYLFDPQNGAGTTGFDSQFRDACDLYNGALEDCLRIARDQGLLSPGQTRMVQSGTQTCEVCIIGCGNGWHNENFHRFEFCSDYEIGGLRNRYRTDGLGVPLIGIRRQQPQDPVDSFYPPGLALPVTAFLRMDLTASGPRQVTLELHDPLRSFDVEVEGQRIPLESDLTTPLAYFLEKGSLPPLATLGLFKPDESQRLRGLYMAEPYEPGKIPVLFVHGLWSDPTTWTEMFNELRASVDVRKNFQFWFYFYPSGQPFWVSASQLRMDLAAARQKLDPHGILPNLDQMILVGHSMGGLVSKMQIVESGDAFWKTASEKSFAEIKASPETLAAMRQVYFFSPNPSVRRVITLGTPHRGSQFANPITRYLGDKLIDLPKMLVDNQQELYQKNPGVFPLASSIRIDTSIDSLAPDSPFLPVLLQQPRLPDVKFHNVVGVEGYRPGQTLPRRPGDGIVSYASAHLDGIDSEKIVDADHLGVHRHPLSVLEVRRILEEHLDAVGERKVTPVGYADTSLPGPTRDWDAIFSPPAKSSMGPTQAPPAPAPAPTANAPAKNKSGPNKPDPNKTGPNKPGPNEPAGGTIWSRLARLFAPRSNVK